MRMFVDFAALAPTVRAMYAEGSTQDEIAAHLSVSRRTINRVMTRNGIARRVAIKRSQRREENDNWRGENATYSAFHHRVEVAKGKPQRCEQCGLDDTNRRYEWANVSGNYADVSDYQRLCVPCHRRFDRAERNLGAYARPAV